MIAEKSLSSPQPNNLSDVIGRLREIRERSLYTESRLSSTVEQLSPSVPKGSSGETTTAKAPASTLWDDLVSVLTDVELCVSRTESLSYTLQRRLVEDETRAETAYRG